MYSRLLNKALIENHSFFLFGPRGTGKTTWIKTQISECIYIDLLTSENYKDLLANPSRLEKMIPPNYQDWVILDEIQRVPDCLNEIHRLIENKGYKFILTGSSARKLRKQGVNLLAGRAFTYYFHPLTTLELKDDFNLQFSLKYGSLPSVYAKSNPEKYLTTYVNTYLREEILQESLVRNLTNFTRFLEIAAFSQGSLLNSAEISREIGVDRLTVENYFSILEDLLIAFRLPVFSKKAKRKLITHNKFYYFDVGVYKAIRPMGPFDLPEEAEGPALETLFLQELRALNDYFEWGYQFYFWRTANGQEVDLILYGHKGLFAFEIKRSSRINRQDLKGLKLFKEDYPIAHCYCFYGGVRKEFWDKEITLLPLSDAFKELVTILDL